MKVYVLAVSNNEGPCQPDVFDTKEKALKGLKDLYEETLQDYAEVLESEEMFVVDYNIYEDSAYITLPEDCITFEIFEAEIK